MAQIMKTDFRDHGEHYSFLETLLEIKNPLSLFPVAGENQL